MLPLRYCTHNGTVQLLIVLRSKGDSLLAQDQRVNISMPKEEPTPPRKSHKKEKKKLKRIHEGTEEPSDLFEGNSSKLASLTPEGGAAGNPVVSADEEALPRSTITSLVEPNGSRCVS